MNRNKINYNDIDPGVRDIVYALNKRIPFTTTGSELIGGSCEGHLTDKLKGEEMVADEGYKFILHGHIMFGIDNVHPKSKYLLRDLKKVSKKYNFAHFYSHKCGNVECPVEGWKLLRLYTNDITKEMKIRDDDPGEVAIRKRYQVRPYIGQKRIEEFQQVWREVMNVLEQYCTKSRPDII